MRRPVKKRIHFFVVAIAIFVSGFQFLPETINLQGNLLTLMPLFLAVFGYFIVVPLLYWFWVIKAGQQKPWKMILALSLSCACARYSFPTDIAHHFEFVVYIKYPIIAVVLIFEFYLMWTIAKGLWNARKLSGDPRVHTLEKYKDNEKKLAVALPMAWEPASWYYMIPRFSKNHIKAICQLNVNACSSMHWGLSIFACLVLGVLSYYLLMGWSEIAAVIVATLICYGVIFLTANHRVAKYYSIYLNHDNKLVINKAFWSMIVINLDDIEKASAGEFNRDEQSEQLILGRGQCANISLTFKTPQTYLAMLGQFPEQVERLWLDVDAPETLIKEINKARTSYSNLSVRENTMIDNNTVVAGTPCPE
ncbi:hypothetical protein [Thalassotalea atypica]|uniref:hypothetical protein n=1 Tax=Thalassotalea atypica TaxID=2054316 RepID=UPI0025723BA5|nr:hypothetical protein [Thalassotalea atypica]